ncbi:MAG: mechanosensitive ion channel domain-containing protein [Planctomycetota bacterium]
MPRIAPRISRFASRRLWRLALGFIALTVLNAPAAYADLSAIDADPAAAEPLAEAAAPEPVDPEFRSPRAAFSTFVQRMREDKKKQAAGLLDLTGFTSAAVESRGGNLAYKLYSVLQRVAFLPGDRGGANDRPRPDGPTTINAPSDPDPYGGVPDNPDAQSPWPLSEWAGRVNDKPAADKITLSRGDDGRWRFSSQTVREIDSLYEEFEEVRVVSPSDATDKSSRDLEFVIRRQFSPELKKTYFVLPTYQWLLLAALWPISRLLDKLTRRVLTWSANRFLRRKDPDFKESDGTTTRVWRPVGRLVAAMTWVYGANVIGLPLAVTNVLFTVLVVVACLLAVAAAFAVIDWVSGYLQRRAKRSNRKFDDLVVPLATSTAKVVSLILIGVLGTLSAFDGDLPTLLIGGLGIGGIAIALASQETLANFVGSLALLLDRPFEVGDWIVSDGVEGEVEQLGFRSTRVRTGPNSQVTVPNSKLAAANVDNLGRRRYRRYLAHVGLEYGTPTERIEAFCEGVRELIRRHPHTRKDFYAAYFNGFGASSLDIIVVAFFEAPDWATELRERHRLLADIARLAESLGVSFAFPTQTVHLHRGDAPPAPADLAEPADAAGARAAAEIAGELPNYQDRPGRVKFPGPTPID